MADSSLLGKTVYVRWDDTSSNSSWTTLEDYKMQPYEVESVGFVIQENRRHLLIAGSLCTQHGKGSDLTTIAKKMILKIKVLR